MRFGSTRIGVSVLLKTSRGLKPLAPGWPDDVSVGFSALEDEPWIEAVAVRPKAKMGRGFSALEDEPWIEAPAVSAAATGISRFQCS